MSVNTYAKIKLTKKGYKFTIYDADTDSEFEPRYFDTLQEALKAFDKENKNGSIEYGLQEVKIK